MQEVAITDSGLRVVPLSGELDVNAAAVLRTELLDLISEQDGTTVVLDLSDVTFVDSTAIGVVIGARKRLLTQGRQLWIAAPSERVLRVLQIVALHKLVPVFGTLDEARRAAAESRNPSEQPAD